MILATMSFDGFNWLHNPLKIQMDYKRKIHSQSLPFQGERLTPMGMNCRVISGKGELVGEGAIEVSQKLESLFLSGEKGLLTVPGYRPFYAYFSKFSLWGEATPDLIFYSFEFVETEPVNKEKKLLDYHIVKEGETLFDIAHSAKTTVDKLVSLNPWVRDPLNLDKGKRVALW